MGFMQKVSKGLFRAGRILTGKKGVYGSLGKGNHFAQGVLIYENATIGSHNYFAPYSLINNARIGNYCSIGPGCRIGLGEHDLSAVSTLPAVGNGSGNMELFDLEHPVVLGCDVWLGANVVIKQGVTVGHGAVIGAGAVVTRDIPPYGIAVGVPAQVKDYRFTEEQRQTLLQSQWFLADLSQAREMAAQLHKAMGDKGEGELR